MCFYSGPSGQLLEAYNDLFRLKKQFKDTKLNFGALVETGLIECTSQFSPKSLNAPFNSRKAVYSPLGCSGLLQWM